MPFYIREMLLFLSQLFCSVLLVVHNQRRRKKFVLRAALTVVAVFGIQLLYVFILSRFYDYRNIPMPLHISKYILALALFIIANFVCFRINFKRAVLLGVRGYAVQNIGAYIYWLIAYYYPSQKQYQVYLKMYTVYFIVWLVYYLLVRKIGEKKLDIELDNKLTVIISVVVISTAIVLSSFAPKFNPAVYLYAITVDFLTIVMQLGVYLFVNRQKEAEMYEQLLRQQHKQHELAKETIEIINFKCHNLKYELAAFMANMANKNDHENKAEITEIQHRLAVYGNITHSGNETLDIVLTEKGLICEKNGITFVCTADGKQIGHMETLDIFNLFGNALDNAIESVSREEDPDKRFISFKMYAQGNLLIIHIENYCAENINFAEGLPVTTKEEKAYHGYGTKAMRAIVEKYHGNMMMYLEQQLFNLDILFPIE